MHFYIVSELQGEVHMSTKSPSKRKAIPVQKETKPANREKSVRSLEELVGSEVYRTWVTMLKKLVPDGRTHRLAPLVAAMLRYALLMAEDKRSNAMDENSLVMTFLYSTETSESSEVKGLLHDVVSRLFKDARVEFNRTSSRGHHYSIADEAYEEYIHWYSRPWE